MATHIILTGVAGACAGEKFEFTSPGYCVIGRAPGCSLRLPLDPTVSRHHCLLEMDGPVLGVRDLGSLNGTFVNGFNVGQRPENPQNATFKLAPTCPLHPGDCLRVGHNVFRVDFEAAAPEQEAAAANGVDCRAACA
jgi:pSer/pThr/pTyr-binding forkhead associated (FHA) protein